MIMEKSNKNISTNLLL